MRVRTREAEARIASAAPFFALCARTELAVDRLATLGLATHREGEAEGVSASETQPQPQTLAERESERFEETQVFEFRACGELEAGGGGVRLFGRQRQDDPAGSESEGEGGRSTFRIPLSGRHLEGAFSCFSQCVFFECLL